LRIGDDGVIERQPSGTAKVNASTFTVSARAFVEMAPATNAANKVPRSRGLIREG
jgi:hypothetical protein